MSHFSSISTEIRDLELAKRALENIRLHLSSYGNCRYYFGSKMMENVVRLPGNTDMAFQRDDNGTYRITADFFDGSVEDAIEEFKEKYAIEKLKSESRQQHFSVMPMQEKSTFRIRDPQSSDGGYMIAKVNKKGEISFEPKGIKGKNCAKFLKLENALGDVTSRVFTAEYGQADMETVQERERLRAEY